MKIVFQITYLDFKNYLLFFFAKYLLFIFNFIDINFLNLNKISKVFVSFQDTIYK